MTSNRTEHLPPMPERNADLLEILIGKMAEDRDINVVISESLGVLSQAELRQPVRNRLHCGLLPSPPHRAFCLGPGG